MKSFFYKVYFALKDNISNMMRSFISSFGILFLIIFFVIYLSFRESVTSYVKGSLFDNLASDEIKILPKNSSGVEFVKRPGSKGIQPQVLGAIRKMDDFAEVNAISRIGFNLRVKGELLGKSKKMYVPVCGVERQFLKGKLPAWKSFTNKDPVPIVAPKFTIDMLNNYFAMDNIPPLPENELIGFPLELTFNSGKKGTPQFREYQYQAVIHSFTDSLNFPGVIVPTDFLVQISRIYAKEEKKSANFEYVVIYAKVKDPNNLPATVDKLKKFGLKVESQKEVTEKTQKAMSIIDGFSFAIIGIFFLLSAISIFNSYLNIVYLRSQKFSLKRVLGFSKLQILISFLIEASIVGALYGVAGYFGGNFLLSSLSESIPKWIPALGAITIAKGNAKILFMCIVLSSAVSAVSALIPAIFASNINLFKAVRK